MRLTAVPRMTETHQEEGSTHQEEVWSQRRASRPQIIRGRRGMPRAEVSNIGRDQQVNDNLLDWDKNRHKGPGVTERKTISEGPKDAQMT